MNFSTQITLGDVIAIAVIAAGVVTNYYGIVRRLDGLDSRQTSTEKNIEDLRRGRGLILGEAGDWPLAVRRCFGFINGHPTPRG